MRLSDVAHIVELRTKLVSVFSFGVALSAVMGYGTLTSLAAAVLFLVTLIGIDMGTTAFNTYFDFIRGTDSHTYTREPDKVLLEGHIQPGSAFFISLALYAVSGLGGLVLVLMHGPWLLLVGFGGAAVGFLYNAGPWPISSGPLGELFAGLFLGAAVVLTFAYMNHIDTWPAVLLIAGGQTSIVAAILTVNNACDRVGDKAAGRRTLSVLLGPGSAIPLLSTLCTVALLLHASAAWLYPSGMVNLMPDRIGTAIILLVVSLYTVRSLTLMFQTGFSHETKPHRMRDVLRLFVACSAAAVAMSLL